MTLSRNEDTKTERMKQKILFFWELALERSYRYVPTTKGLFISWKKYSVYSESYLCRIEYFRAPSGRGRVRDIFKNGVKLWAGFICLRMYNRYEDLYSPQLLSFVTERPLATIKHPHKEFNNIAFSMYDINPLEKKSRSLYLKTQFVPRSKYFSSRYKNQSVCAVNRTSRCSQINTKHIYTLWVEGTVVEC